MRECAVPWPGIGFAASVGTGKIHFVELEKKTGRSRPFGKAKALRLIEGSSAVPRSVGVVSPSVDGDDCIRVEGL